MVKKIKQLLNKSGFFLLESLTGMIILAIILAAFSLTILQANNLFQKAAIASSEWETLFSKIEEKDYPVVRTDGTVRQNVTVYLKDINKSEIILADGTQLATGADIIGSALSQKTMISDIYFTKFQETGKISGKAEDVYIINK